MLRLHRVCREDHVFLLSTPCSYRLSAVDVCCTQLPSTQIHKYMLVLLDLSAAFDTVDHGILLERLRVTFGVDNSALAWFRSYLAGRRQHVHCGGKCSAPIDVICGVPQGSVLGPILIIIYIADLAPIVAEHGLSLHQYADDSQIYGSCWSDATSLFSTTVSRCLDLSLIHI